MPSLAYSPPRPRSVRTSDSKPGVNDISSMVPDTAWDAITNRDATRDGEFVYGVQTTGVYCRPSCSSRQPRRKNVRVFAEAAQAETAGYRPCKRCDPDKHAAPEPAESLVQRACAYIDANPNRPIQLAEIARAAHASPGHLQRTFTRILGISPRAYVDAKRQNQLRQALREGHPVGRAVYDAGYGSSRPVYGPVDAASPLGMPPATYRAGGAGAVISYCVIDAPIGYVVVGATGRGVCSVRIGDRPEQLVAQLRAEFPAAQIDAEPGHEGGWVDSIRDMASGVSDSSHLPLDVRATAFQRRVWEALRQIPAGQTRSYTDVAKAIGAPSSVRAVARACAMNPVALTVPCHRVVRTDGALAGYRWGLERKQSLLDQERARAASEDSRGG